ncbi:FCD domain-containing protein [uncultured Thalassospira sp.]|jgi:GntR family transcriptional repressor for pyruvate dehydrogenase complex|uniref:FadR/GntR family transcriptional regulator n=1 Tax=uncultured Thalassospira sp. TaxID=404382 RepID=UPI0030DB3CB7|tara:strand:- start:17918 stop:18595 length:678 start_codon:yes stop_codon:yes gene_type:complete
MKHNESAPERAARDIRNLIKTKVFQKGDSLPSQRILAHELNVSRASLREALATLEAFGLVRIQAGKGVFVTDPQDGTPRDAQSAHHAAQVYQFRLAIEPYVAGLAAQARTNTHLSALKSSIEEMRQALLEDNLFQAAKADTAFHNILLQAADNPLFLKAMHPTAQSIHENQMLPFANAAVLQAPLQEHEQVLRFVRDRNPSRARDAMHFHVLSAATRANIAFLRP